MDEWTGFLIGKMHNARVTYDDLGKELGVGKAYVCMVLNCRRRPEGAQERFETAFERILEKRGGS